MGVSGELGVVDGRGTAFLKEGEVGIVARLQAAFVLETKAVGDVAGGLGKKVETLVEEEGEAVLNACDAAPHFEDVVAGLEVG